MKYYLKRLGHQELGSVKNGKAQRGRYIYISKDKNVLDIFPPLSKTVTNDSSIIPIIPLYQKIAKKIYCREMNYILDNLTAKQRRKNMQHIKNKDTLIELKLRKKLWNKGYRYRKNVNKLPGKPDIVLSKYKIAIFCDSEFFHGKDWDALKSRLEKSNNSEYWIKKISRNRQRDDEINKRLSFMGWTVVRFWGKEILTNSDECVSVIEDIIWSQKTNLDGSEMIDKEELL